MLIAAAGEVGDSETQRACKENLREEVRWPTGWKAISARSPPSSSDATSEIPRRRNGDLGGNSVNLLFTETAPLWRGARNRTSATAAAAWRNPIRHSYCSRDVAGMVLDARRGALLRSGKPNFIAQSECLDLSNWWKDSTARLDDQGKCSFSVLMAHDPIDTLGKANRHNMCSSRRNAVAAMSATAVRRT